MSAKRQKDNHNNDHDLEWMMWQVDDKQCQDPPIANLIRAIQYFNEKYGSVPNRCEVSEKWSKEIVPPEGMSISSSRTIQPGYILLAFDNEYQSSLPIKNTAK